MNSAPRNKVHMLIHELKHSGASNAAVTLANAIAESKINTQILVIGQKPQEIPFTIHDNVELKFLGISRSKNLPGKILYLLRCYFSLSRYLEKENCRNLFVWGKEFTALAAFMRMVTPGNFRLISVNITNISYHLQNKNIITRYFLNFIYKLLLKKTDYIIAQSAGIAEELRDIYKIPADKITAIAPPLQLRFFNHTAKPAPQKKSNEILFIGRLSEEKGLFTALEIFSKISNKNTILRLVGDGYLEPELKQFASKLGLESRVIFSGRQNDTIPFLHNADILILTSKYEGFGMVLAESIACGVPVVSFDCPSGPSEIVINDVNGYLIPPGDVDLFAKKIDQALEKNWDYKEVAQTANKFHPDVVIMRYLEVIKKYFV